MISSLFFNVDHRNCGPSPRFLTATATLGVQMRRSLWKIYLFRSSHSLLPLLFVRLNWADCRIARYFIFRSVAPPSYPLADGMVG